MVEVVYTVRVRGSGRVSLLFQLWIANIVCNLGVTNRRSHTEGGEVDSVHVRTAVKNCTCKIERRKSAASGAGVNLIIYY